MNERQPNDRGTQECGPIEDLLGVYALDALASDEERRSVEDHLRDCVTCSDEVFSYRETVGLMASDGGQADEAIWEKIAGHLELGSEPVGQPDWDGIFGRNKPVVGGEPKDNVVQIDTASGRKSDRRRWLAISSAAVAACAAVIAIGVQSVRVDNLNHKVGQLEAAAGQPGAFQGAASAMTNPNAKHFHLVSMNSAAQYMGQLVVLPRGAAYLVGSKLPGLSQEYTYQLWSEVSGKMISVGLLGANPSGNSLTLQTGSVAKAFYVTVEPSGGTISPTSEPVAKAVT